jgi:hypothetical protein
MYSTRSTKKLLSTNVVSQQEPLASSTPTNTSSNVITQDEPLERSVTTEKQTSLSTIEKENATTSVASLPTREIVLVSPRSIRAKYIHKQSSGRLCEMMGVQYAIDPNFMEIQPPFVVKSTHDNTFSLLQRRESGVAPLPLRSSLNRSSAPTAVSKTPVRSTLKRCSPPAVVSQLSQTVRSTEIESESSESEKEVDTRDPTNKKINIDAVNYQVSMTV